MIENISNKLCNVTHKVIHSGLILLSICVDIRGEGEYSRLKSAPKLYFLLPRVGYLLTLTDSIQDYYNFFDKKFLNLIENHKCWFEFDNFKINSGHPIGLLFDIHNKNNNRILFDIKLVIDLQSREYIENRNVEFNEKENIFKYNINKTITNNIKLSQSVLFGDCRKFQMFGKKEYDNLFSCIHSLSKTTCKYDFIIRKLFGTSDEIYKDVINIPVKIYIEDKMFLKSFKKKINNRLLEINDVLIDVASDIDEDYNSVNVLFHGIMIPYDTPLIFLMAYCSYIDGIVHIVFKN